MKSPLFQWHLSTSSFKVLKCRVLSWTCWLVVLMGALGQNCRSGLARWCHVLLCQSMLLCTIGLLGLLEQHTIQLLPNAWPISPTYRPWHIPRTVPLLDSHRHASVTMQLFTADHRTLRAPPKGLQASPQPTHWHVSASPAAILRILFATILAMLPFFLSWCVDYTFLWLCVCQ